MDRFLALCRRLTFRLGEPGFYASALLVMFIVYLPILALSFGLGFPRLVATAVANVAPVGLLGIGIRQLIRGFLLGRRTAVQAAAHCMLAIVFTFLWFWLLMVLLGAVAGTNAVEFSVRPFRGPAAAWQLFQGLFVYAALAIAVHSEALAQSLQPATKAEARDPQRPRLFIRQDDEIRPLDLTGIIMVRGADDYSEVVTANGNHLVRMTLTVMAERLGEGFIRIHRSCLVNLDKVLKAEPAGGGRMLLHMESGEMVHTSRAGSRLLRNRVI